MCKTQPVDSLNDLSYFVHLHGSTIKRGMICDTMPHLLGQDLEVHYPRTPKKWEEMLQLAEVS